MRALRRIVVSVAAVVGLGSAVGLGSVASAETVYTLAPQPARGLKPTPAPTLVPKTAPTLVPKVAPSAAPTPAPSATPTPAPSAAPTAAPTTAPTTAPSTTPFTSSEISALLTALNAERALPRTPTPAVPVPPLTWDTNLASTAQTWASTCTLAHNSNRATAGFASVGETLWATTAPYSTAMPNQAVGAWVSEKSLYTYGKVTATNVAATSRYTQIIWQSTLKVGCAYATCASLANAPAMRTILVCNYGNSGNYVDQYPYPAAGFP